VNELERLAEEIRRFTEPLRALLPRFPKLPPTRFHCAICNERVGRFVPRQDKKNFQVPTDFTCPTHGALQEPDFDKWLATWERRGRPDWTVLRLPPV
jgi:hypothetical protein